jgi:hypothetical protein
VLKFLVTQPSGKVPASKFSTNDAYDEVLMHRKAALIAALEAIADSFIVLEVERVVIKFQEESSTWASWPCRPVIQSTTFPM